MEKGRTVHILRRRHATSVDWPSYLIFLISSYQMRTKERSSRMRLRQCRKGTPKSLPRARLRLTRLKRHTKACLSQAGGRLWAGLAALLWLGSVLWASLLLFLLLHTLAWTPPLPVFEMESLLTVLLGMLESGWSSQLKRPSR